MVSFTAKLVLPVNEFREVQKGTFRTELAKVAQNAVTRTDVGLAVSGGSAIVKATITTADGVRLTYDTALDVVERINAAIRAIGDSKRFLGFGIIDIEWAILTAFILAAPSPPPPYPSPPWPPAPPGGYLSPPPSASPSPPALLSTKLANVAPADSGSSSLPIVAIIVPIAAAFALCVVGAYLRSRRSARVARDNEPAKKGGGKVLWMQGMRPSRYTKGRGSGRFHSSESCSQGAVVTSTATPVCSPSVFSSRSSLGESSAGSSAHTPVRWRSRGRVGIHDASGSEGPTPEPDLSARREGQEDPGGSSSSSARPRSPVSKCNLLRRLPTPQKFPSRPPSSHAVVALWPPQNHREPEAEDAVVPFDAEAADDADERSPLSPSRAAALAAATASPPAAAHPGGGTAPNRPYTAPKRLGFMSGLLSAVRSPARVGSRNTQILTINPPTSVEPSPRGAEIDVDAVTTWQPPPQSPARPVCMRPVNPRAWHSSSIDDECG